MGKSFLDIFIISDHRDSEDFLVESCGETDESLNSYSVILKQDKVKDFLEIVGNSFGPGYVEVTRELLEMDEESVMEGFKQFRTDTDFSFTYEFLDTLGSSRRIIDVDKQRKLLDGYEEPLDSEDVMAKPGAIVKNTEPLETTADSELSDEDMMLLNPSNNSEEIESLKTKIAELEGESALSLATINDLKSQLSALKSQADTIDSSLNSMIKEFKEVNVPDFAVTSIINTIGEINPESTKDAIRMIIQDYCSINNNYVLSTLIASLVDKYEELEVITIER